MRPICSIVLSILLSSLLLACGPEADDGPGDWGSPYDATEDGWLLSVHGPSADDLYAVGGSPTAAAMLHYDGSSWSPVQIGVDVPLLNWVYAFASDNVYAVGNGGTVIHYDGTSWTQQTTPTDEDLWGVWGSGPDDIWAVGGRGRMAGQATILRNQGQGWEEVVLPALDRPNVFAFFKVWGTSGDNVYIVGQRGILLQWDGQQLNELAVGTGEDLISVWGTGPDRIAVVGGRNNGVLARWDGQTWALDELAPMPGLNGVWIRDSVIHVAGNNGTLATLDWDTLERTAPSLGTDLTLHALFGDDSNTITAVGGNLAFVQGPFNGLLMSRRLGKNE